MAIRDAMISKKGKKIFNQNQINNEMWRTCYIEMRGRNL